MTTSITAVDRDGTQHSLEWEEDQTLMEVLRDNDLPVLASCGGTASCATCHVFLEESVAQKLGERSADELELLEDAAGYRACGSRLACQIEHDESLDGIRVELAPES
jgi:2Fe-2S ferredoxin